MSTTLPPELISESDIRDRVKQLAARISADYANEDEVVLIGVLKGAFIFLADLSRQLTIPRSIEFIAVSSYGDRESDVAESVRHAGSILDPRPIHAAGEVHRAGRGQIQLQRDRSWFPS